MQTEDLNRLRTTQTPTEQTTNDSSSVVADASMQEHVSHYSVGQDSSASRLYSAAVTENAVTPPHDNIDGGVASKDRAAKMVCLSCAMFLFA